MAQYQIKVPHKIKVGGFDYKICQSKRIEKELDAEAMWGSHSEILREIHLMRGDGKISAQQYSQSFLHEVIHSINAVYRRSKLDEDDISGISRGLHQVFEQLGIRFIK